MSLLTNRGNLKSKTITNAVLLDKRTDKIVRYWRKSGFPYIETSKKFREEKFKSFMKTSDRSSLDFNNRMFKFNNGGNAQSRKGFRPSAPDIEELHLLRGRGDWFSIANQVGHQGGAQIIEEHRF